MAGLLDKKYYFLPRKQKIIKITLRKLKYKNLEYCFLCFLISFIENYGENRK